MYAIVKTGGKQYRVEQGQWLLVERLHVDDGASVSLRPLLVVDGSDVIDGEALDKVTVSAKVLGHERGPKLRIVKFKPKRGYKRRNGHRQELTRIEVTSIKAGAQSRSGAAKKTPKEPEPEAVAAVEETVAPAPAPVEAASATAPPEPEAAAEPEAAPATPTSEDDNGA